MSEPITILLIDDHRVVRQGVRAFLATQPDLLVVGEAASGAEGVSLAEQLAPDVALMDLVMPGMDGVEATRRIKRASPRTQIVVLTSYHDDEHVLPALRAGALSYILKDIGVDDKFMKTLGEELAPGSAALIVLVRESTPDKVLPRISPFGGKVMHTSLSDEAETRLQEALDTHAAA